MVGDIVHLSEVHSQSILSIEKKVVFNFREEYKKKTVI